MIYIAAFYTHYGAMKFYKACQERGVPVKLMPTPRKLSASCGVCAQFEAEQPVFPPGQYDLYDLEDYYLVSENGEYSKWTFAN